MDQFVSTIERINKVVNGFAWGPVMLLLLVGTGIYLTVLTRGIQVRRFGYILRNTIGTLFAAPATLNVGAAIAGGAAVLAMVAIVVALIVRASQKAKQPRILKPVD